MRSTERILTTHTGRPPTPGSLVKLLWEKSEEREVDESVFEAQVADAVKSLVQQQRDAGIDVVNDGEASKIGFSTYIYERYAGFGEPVAVLADAKDLNDFPELAERMMGIEAVSHVHLRHCERAIELKDPEPVKVDIENLAASLNGTPREMAFL